MDPVSEFFRSWKIPVGKWGKAAIDFIIDWFQWLFDGMAWSELYLLRAFLQYNSRDLAGGIRARSRA